MSTPPWNQRNDVEGGMDQSGGVGFHGGIFHRNTFNIHPLPPAGANRQDSFASQDSSTSAAPLQLPATASPAPRTLSPPQSKHDFRIGWITALDHELSASLAALDEKYLLPSMQSGDDDNTYNFGRIGDHYIVMACLPSYGTNAAAAAAKDMKRSFPSIMYCFMVGIGGGVPSNLRDIRLGDVVVSTEVIPYEIGKVMPDGKFERRAVLNNPPVKLLGAVRNLRATHTLHSSAMIQFMEEIARGSTLGFRRPDVRDDLYRAGELVQRLDRPYNHPFVHSGKIASGNKVVASEEDRDRLRADDDILCFEMEAAGIMNIFPCLAIRGICDYCDSNKSGIWQNYAAAAAASYTKELLRTLPSSSTPYHAENSPSRQPTLGHPQTWNTSPPIDPFVGPSHAVNLPRANTFSPSAPGGYLYQGAITRAATMDENQSLDDTPSFVASFSLSGLQQEVELVGRADVTAKLEDFFSPMTVTERPPQSRRVFVLHGPSGVGKSALCTNYVRQYHRQYDAVVWIDGSTLEAISRSVRAFVNKPEIGKGRDFGNSADDQVVQYLLDWLKMRANVRWLLCFDNFDTWKYKLENLLPDADHGSILVTTTRHSLRRLGTKAVEIKFLDGDDSKNLLALHVERSIESDVDAAATLRKLKGLPVALKWVGRFVKDRLQTFSKYNDQYNGGWAGLMKRQDTYVSGQHGGGADKMSNLWTSSCSQLFEQRSEATRLLNLWSFFGFNRLHYGLFKPVWRPGHDDRPWPDWLRELVQSEPHFDDVVSELTEIHLAERETHEEKSFYTVHPVFHEWYFNKALLRGWTKCFELCELAGALMACQVLTDRTADQYCQTHIKLYPHARMVFQRSTFLLDNQSSDIPKPETKASVFFSLGLVLYENDEFYEAKDAFQRAWDSHIYSGQPTLDEEAIRAKYYLGKTFGRRRIMEEATSTFEESRELAERDLGTQDPLTVRIKMDLARMKQKQFQYDDAKTMLHSCLGFALAHPMDDPLLEPDVQTYLCNFYHDKKEFDKAIRSSEKALACFEKLLGRDAVETVSLAQSIGSMYRERDKQEEAERFFTQAGEGLNDALGGDIELRQAQLRQQGFLYQDEGKLDQAGDMFRRALQLSDELQESSTTIAVLGGLGGVCRKQKRHDEAERAFERAFKACESRAPRDRYSLRMLYELALVRRDRLSADTPAGGSAGLGPSDKFDEALKTCKDAYRGYCDALGPGYQFTVHMAHTIASLYRRRKARGDLEHEREWCKRAYDGCRDQLGDDRPATCKAALKLADVYRSFAAGGNRQYEEERKALVEMARRNTNTHTQ